MHIEWPGKHRNTGSGAADRPLPSSVSEDDATDIARTRRFSTWIDEIVEEHRQQGGFENLEGSGRPLNLNPDEGEGALLNKVLKNANVLPEWLDLQHQIRGAMGSLVSQLERGIPVDVNRQVQNINQKIRRYNEVCPSPLLQRPTVTVDNVASQYKRWL